MLFKQRNALPIRDLFRSSLNFFTKTAFSLLVTSRSTQLRPNWGSSIAAKKYTTWSNWSSFPFSSTILVLAKIPENLFKRDCRRAMANCRQWVLDSTVWSRWVFKSSTVGTTILIVTIFSPSVRSVASAKGERMAPKSFSWFHSRTEKRTCWKSVPQIWVRALWSSDVRACSCLNVLFQRVDVAAGMDLWVPNAASNRSLNWVLVWSNEVNFDILASAEEKALASFIPSCTTNCRECAKHDSLCRFLVKTVSSSQVTSSQRLSSSKSPSSASLSSLCCLSCGSLTLNAHFIFAALSVMMYSTLLAMLYSSTISSNAMAIFSPLCLPQKRLQSKRKDSSRDSSWLNPWAVTPKKDRMVRSDHISAVTDTNNWAWSFLLIESLTWLTNRGMCFSVIVFLPMGVYLLSITFRKCLKCWFSTIDSGKVQPMIRSLMMASWISCCRGELAS